MTKGKSLMPTTVMRYSSILHYTTVVYIYRFVLLCIICVAAQATRTAPIAIPTPPPLPPPPTVSPPPAVTPQPRSLEDCLRSGLDLIARLDTNSVFAAPVTDLIAPKYSRIIKFPMDLSTMRRKLTQRAYTSVAAFDKDMELMFENCIEYNKKDDFYIDVSEYRARVYSTER